MKALGLIFVVVTFAATIAVLYAVALGARTYPLPWSASVCQPGQQMGAVTKRGVTCLDVGN